MTRMPRKQLRLLREWYKDTEQGRIARELLSEHPEYFKRLK